MATESCAFLPVWKFNLPLGTFADFASWYGRQEKQAQNWQWFFCTFNRNAKEKTPKPSVQKLNKPGENTGVRANKKLGAAMQATTTGKWIPLKFFSLPNFVFACDNIYCTKMSNDVNSMFIFRIRCEQRINEEHTGSTEEQVFFFFLASSSCFSRFRSTGVTCLLAAAAAAMPVENISGRLSNAWNVYAGMRHELVTTVKTHKLPIWWKIVLYTRARERAENVKQCRSRA